MPNLVRRGQIIFVAIAALLIGSTLFNIGASLLGDWDKIKWWKSIVVPLIFAASIAGLWSGDRTIKWIAVAGCVLPGLLLMIGAARAWNALKHAGLSANSEPDVWLFQTVAIMASLGAVRVTLGLLLGLLPSVNAFFAYQRGEPGATSASHPVLWTD